MLAGGAGDDIYYVDRSDYIGGERAGGGIDRVYSSGDFTLSAHLNQLFLTGSTAVQGYGNASPNVIGGNGADNSLVGWGGNDRLFGLAGDDALLAGAGDDTVTGGTGADRFDVWTWESPDTRIDRDVITDYNRAEGDVVQLPYGGYTVIGVVDGALRIEIANGDIVSFTGITDVNDILFA